MRDTSKILDEGRPSFDLTPTLPPLSKIILHQHNTFCNPAKKETKREPLAAITEVY